MASISNRVPPPPGHTTWHITSVDTWESQRHGTWYRPEAFEAERFIHCTDDLKELLAVGNRYYREDRRSWLALEIDCDRVTSLIVYEDEQRMFPHIYGPLELAAVRRVAAMVRADDGAFIDIAIDV